MTESRELNESVLSKSSSPPKRETTNGGGEVKHKKEITFFGRSAVAVARDAE